ncbi:RimK family protein [Thioalkalivibrio sp. XN8]|uniref:RimK family protein n=1 Tax=Thioalkalivibrio sp. XN8 TaxID=2712863 RepID=UPI0013ECC033|nr:RimK family protein [Thioalkalivibrio sp. XN8]NGP52976.1 RimK family protein [Thioalkalivibrio sp. XN8]
MKRLIVVDNPADWPLSRAEDGEVIPVSQYLAPAEPWPGRGVRVFNLARSYGYQTRGYYVSLLAEARGHRVIPDVRTIQDLNAPGFVRFIPTDVEELVQKSLGRLKSDDFVLSIYFGENLAAQHQALARALFRLFPAPFLRAKFGRGQKWNLRGVRALSLDEIPPQHLDFMHQAAQRYFSRKRYAPERSDRSRYDLAILVNPAEREAPSDRQALQRFVKAARRQGFGVELIGRDDYPRLAEFDALFIRETTAVNHHTWRFARRAQAEGLAVIDDPDSILRCANKVYLAEVLKGAGIPTPRTEIIQRGQRRPALARLGLPCVLKVPDSSFSQGVAKATTEAEYLELTDRMLEASDLVIGQEFVPTEFDWRVGVLEGEPLFVCKYFMARGHWQIYNWASRRRRDVSGQYETLAVADAPQAVVQMAVKAARLMGDGFYGVDLKELDGKPVVIEINDNPSVESDVEDKVLGPGLYDAVIASLRRRVEARREGEAR